MNVNTERHLTVSYPYAHFSRITNINYILYPGLLFTRPTYITLKSGDALYIPKNWWHWIRTEPGTHAINFIFNAKTSIKSIPTLIDNLVDTENIKIIQEAIDKKAGAEYDNWNNASYTTLEYLITLNGYSKFKKNMNIKEEIKHISALSYIKDTYAKPGSEFDYNFWISLSKGTSGIYHDTGLHYDSLDGILYCINGTKTITLYPPEDSYLLAPFDTTPNYAVQTPIFMYYNAYSKGDVISGKPSGHLLYKTLDFCATSTTILTAVQKIYDKSLKKNLIWGFKKAGDVYRWELYNYHYSSTDKFVDKSHVPTLFIKPISKNILDILMDSDTIINSIDIENTVDVFNDEIHIYQVKNSKNAPYYGKGFDIKNNKIKQVGVFVYHAAHEVKKNHAKYFKEVGLPHDMGMLRILLKYPCDHLCIWNKNGDIFIQWIGIDIHYFISFLEEFNYKKDLVTYIKDHIEDYRSLSHEITIVYDPVSRLPKRSGFYGCI